MPTVLITGASTGIGNATARVFQRADWDVYATARDPTDIEELRERGCMTMPLDVTKPDEIEAVVSEITDAEEQLDCVVNNAGYAQYGPLEDLPISEVRQQYNVNVHGPHRVIRAVLPLMRAQNSGTIINMSSIAGRVSFPGGSAYAGAKFALEAMTDALRTEIAKFDIDVVLVEPGPVQTQFRNRAKEELRAGPERTGAYDAVYGLLDDSRIIGDGSPFETSPEIVAEAVLHAAECPDTPARYPVGPLASWICRTRYLPDSWRDKAFGLALRLAG